MKAIGLVFSARKSGNGFHCMKYCLNRLKNRGFETSLINCFDYDVKPCSHCNYECYAQEIRGTYEECPVKDDVSRIYGLIKDADWLLFAVPCYGGHVSAIYRAWAERIPHIQELNIACKSFEEFQKRFLHKIKGLILFGNLASMGDMALHEILTDFYNIQAPETLLLQSTEYGKSSLKGNMVESEAVKESLDRFVKRLIETFGK